MHTYVDVVLVGRVVVTVVVEGDTVIVEVKVVGLLLVGVIGIVIGIVVG